MIALMLKSTIVILAAAAAAALLRRQSAAVRHFVWAAGLVGALAVPLSSRLLPAWDLPLAGGIVPALGGWTYGEIALGAWLAGASIGILLLLLSAGHLAWVALRARPFKDPRWLSIAEEIGETLAFSRPVRLLQTDKAAFLGTWGVLRPHVLLPAGAEHWSGARIRMVLAHELAHARRRDWPVQVLAEASRAIYWFNPLFWLAASRLRSESEHASDDCVLDIGIDGAEYAEELVGLTRSFQNQDHGWLPLLGMAHRSHIETRLMALLNPSLKRLAATPWAIIVVVLVAVGLTLPLAAVRTQPAAPPEAPLAALKPIATTPASRIEPAPESAETLVVAPETEACPVTPSVRDTPPRNPQTAALGSGPWFVNEARSIWVWDQPWVAGEQINTVAVRPEGARLVITGRRLGPEGGADMESTVNPAGMLAFKTGGLLFPTGGCWEVTASAGESVLTFVTEVGR